MSMAGFSLPKTQTDNTAAFREHSSASGWLARQPLTNAPLMLAELTRQIEAFNSFRVLPRERFKTMEVLRKTVFAVSGDAQRRYEAKPLPLLPAEQAMFDLTRRLWRACTIAYLHCLHASLDQEASLAGESARVAHRVLSCLRMEQMADYLAGVEPEGEFWSLLHSVWSSVESLAVAYEPIVDRLLGETRESTVGGQYGMALLLHLADSFSLTRGQFAAVTRWFARWREQTKVLVTPETDSKSFCIPLDLAQGRPIHDARCVVGSTRWLSVGMVVRKMRQRLERLAAGESPESLKLGSGLSSEACASLLTLLCERLMSPQSPVRPMPGEALSIVVGSGLENCHGLLGGKGLKEFGSSSTNSTLHADQLAIFGHVVRETEGETKAENWQIMGKAPGVLHLLRPRESGESRLVLKALLVLQGAPQQKKYTLATISSLSVRAATDESAEGALSITASLLPGEPVPLIAELREKPAGKVSRHPAFLLQEDGAQPASVVLPAGLHARALSIRFHEAKGQTPLKLQLSELIERGGDNERWLCSKL